MNEIKMTENKTLLVVDTKIREKRVDEKTKNEVIEVICKMRL